VVEVVVGMETKAPTVAAQAVREAPAAAATETVIMHSLIQAVEVVVAYTAPKHQVDVAAMAL
jgi:hypothetical protein